MLTYQLQDRFYKIKDGGELVFPNDVEIQILLEPPEPFGAAAGPSRTAVRAHKAKLLYDANTGRSTIQSEPPLERLQVILEYANMRFELIGNKVILQTRCNSGRELDDLVGSLHFGIPLTLNVEFADPPVVKQTSGSVGKTRFNWEMRERKFLFETTTQETQEKRIATTFERLQLFGGGSNRRLLAALHYFHMACRLGAVGKSPWEFMAESVLNLSKVLQILFGEQRDDVRAGLAELGYLIDEIERDFIPIMVLRNEFDVGHVAVELFKPKQLEALYKYLEDAEMKFRDLLRRILDKVRDGAYKLPPDPDLYPNREKRMKIEELIRNLGKEQSNQKLKKEVNHASLHDARHNN